MQYIRLATGWQQRITSENPTHAGPVAVDLSFAALRNSIVSTPASTQETIEGLPVFIFLCNNSLLHGVVITR